jgi:hypothetical protein
VRASDQDRDVAAAALREHFAAGRLTQEELGERLQGIYAAQDQSELRQLTADLPALPMSPAQQRAALAQRRTHLQRRLLQSSGGGMAAFLICTVVWVAGGASGMFWPIWVALAFVIPLARGAWELYGPAPDLDRFEAQLERRESAREAQREHHLRRAERRARRGRG